ncbi:MAG: WD40 repeat domain-containing protein, partial [Planctomycetota bacterium]|nr:WD40 repeat domain-containing protein [Planctomycetota bacterium]
EESYAPIRPVLQCLVAAEEPLSIGQLAEASGLELSEELPRQVRKLSSFIRQQNHPAGLSGGKLTLYHKSITDWLTNPDRCSDIHFISKREGHRRLANSCWQEYQDFITHWKPAERYPANRSLSDYSLRHLATHLTAIQSWEGLETILTDLRWVEARALTGQVFELLADYSHSLGSLPELQTERQETVRRQQELRDYAKELIEYARYQIDERLKAFEESEKTNLGLVAPEGSLSVPTPPAPPDTRPIQEDMIQAQAAADQPSGKKLSRENQVRSFSNFVSQFCHRLANFPEQTVTSAVNHAVDGPVTKQAEELVRLLSQNWFFRRPRPPSYCDRPLGALCLEGHTDVVSGVDMTSDGALAVSSSWDGTVRLWNPTDGKCLRVFRGHEGWVNDVAMTPDGTIAVSVGRDETMKVWEMNTGQCLFSLRGHRSELRGVGLSADGRIAVSSSADKTLRVWDLRAGVCLNTLEGHTHAVNAVAVSADGCTAVSASDDKTVRVWDTFSGQCLRTLTGHEEKVLYVSLSANGYRMVSGDTERGLLWNPSSGECLDTMKGLGGPAVLTPDCLSVVAPGPWVSVFDIQQRRKIRHFRAHNQMPMAVAVTADGTTALTGTWDKILHKWDLQRGRIKQQAGGHEAPILGLAKTRDAGVISVDYAGLLCIWDSQGNVRNKIRDSEWAFTSVALDREGRLAVTGCLKAGNPSLCIWDLQKEVCIHTIEGHSDLITAVTFHSDGNSFISASYDKTLRVWDLESGKTIRILEGHKDMVSDLAITPDGSLAVSASHDETIRIWCVADGQCVRIIEGHTDWIYKMAFTPEGDKVISAGKEPKLYVWDFHTGQLVRTIEGHTESVRGLAVTPCGNHLVSSSDDCTLRFWDIKTGKCLALYVSDIPVDFLAIPTPGRIVGGSADGQMHFLDLIMPHMTN